MRTWLCAWGVHLIETTTLEFTRYTCTCACRHACTHARRAASHARTYARMHMHAHTPMRPHARAGMHACARAHTYTRAAQPPVIRIANLKIVCNSLRRHFKHVIAVVRKSSSYFYCPDKVQQNGLQFNVFKSKQYECGPGLETFWENSSPSYP